jgi:hypothetical protein
MAGKLPRKAIQVLLIEDDVEDARLVKWALSRAQSDFEVESIGCLADALEWLGVKGARRSGAFAARRRACR